MPRKRKVEPSPLEGMLVTVGVERCGAFIRADNVKAEVAGMVMADILDVFRVLSQKYGELVPDLGVVPGGTPIEYVDDWSWEQRRKRIGFQ